MPTFQNNHASDFVRTFLFGDAVFHREQGRIGTSIQMDARMEGWVGIPHGGIGMGAVMELASMLHPDPAGGEAGRPVTAEFRLGGSSLHVGDSVELEVSSADGGVTGKIMTDRDALPYLEASIGYDADDLQDEDVYRSCLPASVSEIEQRLIPLPHYRNCFVCGVQRRYPGLGRRLHLFQDEQAGKIVISQVGFDAMDGETFWRFQKDGIVHPVALLAIIDETMGWSGFMVCASGAVTVRIGYTFYRPVRVGEKVVIFGRCDRTRGKAGSRLMFWTSGGAAVVRDDGSFETVVAASAQFFGVPALTEQMKRELMPRDLTLQAFRLAGADC